MDGGQQQDTKDDNNVVVSGASADSNVVQPVSTAIPPKGSDGSITWSASEFISHSKGPLWYLMIAATSIVAALIAYLLTKDKITAGVFVVAALMLAIFGAKKPRTQQYRVDGDGIYVGQKKYPFASFRSFSVVRQGDFASLVFMPLKRFSMSVTSYYDPQDEEKIVAVVSQYLPLEERKRDLLDDLMWRIRF